jgi:hypothetical protein
MVGTAPPCPAFSFHFQITGAFPMNKVANTDPILAAIERHRAAATAYRSASDVHSPMGPGEPGEIAAAEASNAAMGQHDEALLALLTCQPTTMAGLLAVLEHVGQPEFLIYPPREGTGETVLSGVYEMIGEMQVAGQKLPLMLAAAGRGLMAPLSDAGADARLLELGQRFEAAWAEQRRLGDALDAASAEADGDPPHETAAHEAAHSRASRIADEIVAIPAQTIAGLRVKARTVLWCHAGEPWAQENPPRIVLLDGTTETTDYKVTESILADLLRCPAL